MVSVGLALGGFVGLLFLCVVLSKWNDVRCRGEHLPPGTMGWPLAGETMEFLKRGPNFMKNQRARYGNLFKSHILGCPTVISSDADANRFILMNEGKGIVPGYPQSMIDILGKWNVAAVHGALHKSMRGAILSLLGPTAIRLELLPKLDSFVRSHVSHWGGQTVDIQEKMKEMSFLTALKLVAGIDSGNGADALSKEFNKLLLGSLSLPIDFPGTSYRRGLHARKKIVSILSDLVRERRGLAVDENKDMLSSLISGATKMTSELTDEQMIDLLISILYAGYETVSTTSMMCLKYLHDHPRALQEIRDEHVEIRGRKSAEDAINWEDYKSMNFTRAVIFETLRLATIINGVLRKTTEDLEIEGFTIPRGWKIYVYTRESNYDPFQYPEPLRFNPWRWQDKSLESHPNFTPFGGGSRLCPGKELGIAQISTFLHYFLTRYSWTQVGDDEILHFPRVEAAKGLHIRIQDI
ncbi:cytochrome P450 85A-like [Wolffia australiana]